MKIYRPLVILFLLGLFSCITDKSSDKDSETSIIDSNKDDVELSISDEINTIDDSIEKEALSPIEQKVISQGLVDVVELDSSINLDIRYATRSNFMGKVLYKGYDKCFLQAEVGNMLVQAHKYLKESHPDLRFLIFDGTRPRSIQVQMWDKVKGTPQQQYVASPGKGSMHNFGAAVDLSLTHIDTGEVDMGTEYDFFGDKAQPRYEEKFLNEGVLSGDQVTNRRILRRAMNKAGFTGILSEWWHFNAFSNKETRSRFNIVE